jgi:hypothetical protein
MLSVGKFRSLGPMPNDRGELLVQQDIDLGTNVASPVLNVAQEAFEATAHNKRTLCRRGLLSKCDTAPSDVEIDQNRPKRVEPSRPFGNHGYPPM